MPKLVKYFVAIMVLNAALSAFIGGSQSLVGAAVGLLLAFGVSSGNDLSRRFSYGVATLALGGSILGVLVGAYLLLSSNGADPTLGLLVCGASAVGVCLNAAMLRILADPSVMRWTGSPRAYR